MLAQAAVYTASRKKQARQHEPSQVKRRLKRRGRTANDLGQELFCRGPRRRWMVANDCVVCGQRTPAVDEAWSVAICAGCAIDVLAPLVGRALVLDGSPADLDRRQGQ